MPYIIKKTNIDFLKYFRTNTEIIDIKGKFDSQYVDKKLQLANSLPFLIDDSPKIEYKQKQYVPFAKVVCQNLQINGTPLTDMLKSKHNTLFRFPIYYIDV